MGLIVGPDGIMIMQEQKGPPDYPHWYACWIVFQMGMIMVDACIPPWLIAYAKMICEFASLYGPS